MQTNPKLPALLNAVDRLSGGDRQSALETMIGVHAEGRRNLEWVPPQTTEEDLQTLRTFAEAVSKVILGCTPGDLADNKALENM